jgi:hypothetical protein
VVPSGLIALDPSCSTVSDEGDHFHPTEGADELHVVREVKRLTRVVEYMLPSSSGWDAQASAKVSSEDVG